MVFLIGKGIESLGTENGIESSLYRAGVTDAYEVQRDIIMGIKVPGVSKTRTWKLRGRLIALNAKYAKNWAEKLLTDVLEDAEYGATPEKYVSRSYLDAMNEMLGHLLTEDEMLVIRSIYVCDLKTLTEISQHSRIYYKDIRQLHREALAKLREPENLKKVLSLTCIGSI